MTRREEAQRRLRQRLWRAGAVQGSRGWGDGGERWGKWGGGGWTGVTTPQQASDQRDLQTLGICTHSAEGGSF